MNCQICGNYTTNMDYKVKEMMLGLREEFTYFLCGKCQCLQIKELPKNMEKYYPTENYRPWSTGKLDSVFTKPSFYQRGLIYKVLRYFLMLDSAIFSIGKLNLPKDSRILDVGSGSGTLLNKLKRLGYSNLIGLDPFINHEIIDNNPAVKIRKITINGLDEKEYFDLIMFHHSFEHMPNPLEVLLDAKKHLLKNGIILIRTPIVSYAFEKYGSNWYQIDAPRHFFIYSINAMRLIIEKAGLRLKETYFDSNEYQFISSERYLNNIAFSEVKKRSSQAIFRKLYYRKATNELNKEGKGDTAVFYVTA